MSDGPGGGEGGGGAGTTGERVAWFHCLAGIAGDMTLGSLVDAGADTDEVLRLLGRLPVGGWSLDFEQTTRNGIACTRALVEVTGDGVVRTWMHVLGVLEEARLPPRVRDRAVGAFSALAEAEGRVHRRTPSEVRFHEVGGHDTLVDIVGSAAALEQLEVDRVTSSAVPMGTGVLESAHGHLPNPPPAVIELMKGIPSVGLDVPHELTTPTGAAMLRAWSEAFGPMPAMTVEAAGYGAGSREIDGLPNCTQVVIGTAPDQERRPVLVDGANEPLVLLEANLDDVTGETLAHALRVLLDSGALDAWVAPVVMKKGRPGHLVSVLTRAPAASRLAAVLSAETGSLGVRAHALERWSVPRSLSEVSVEGLPVRVKVSAGRAKAEHDDVVRAARRLGLTALEVAARAEAAWKSRS